MKNFSARSWRLAALAPALVLLAACSPFNVRYDFDRGAAFSAYHSYDWFPPDPKAKAGAAENPIMERRVRRIVEQELAARGFRHEAGGNPDFRVACYPTYRERQVSTYTDLGPPWWGYGWGMRPWGYYPAVGFQETRSYREGSIVLEIIDFNSNQLVWKGAAEGALSGLEDPQDAEEQVAAAVRKLLANFPPGR
jgi:hypothetical protein